MQNDDITWSIINKSFCSFKVSTSSQNFCREPHNVTGLCSRSACPLANSQYATIREENGICYLYIRTAERFYFPVKQWEKIKLSKNFKTALRQIDENLILFKKYFRQKCRQRLLKITQYLTRMRSLKLNPQKNLIPIRRKLDLRIKRREQKALVAAKTEFEIEKKLLQRLKEGVYGKIYNFDNTAFEEVIKEGETEEKIESYKVVGEEIEDEDKSKVKNKVLDIIEKEIQQEEDDEELEREFVGDFEESEDEEEIEDLEDMDIERTYVNHLINNDNDDEDDDDDHYTDSDDESVTSPSAKKRKLNENSSKNKLNNISKVKKLLKKPKVKIEYEEEEEEEEEESVKPRKMKIAA